MTPTRIASGNRAVVLRNAEGSVYVEYLVITCLVSIGAAFAIAVCGVMLLHLLHYQQTTILFPLP